MRKELIAWTLAILLPLASWAGELPGAETVKVLGADEACSIARQETVNEKGLVSIEGLYISDGMHGAMFEIPGCTIAVNFLEPAWRRVGIFHDEFARQCGGMLMGDFIRGKFIGIFTKKQYRSFAGNPSIMQNVFVISDFESEDLSPERIKCS